MREWFAVIFGRYARVPMSAARPTSTSCGIKSEIGASGICGVGREEKAGQEFCSQFVKQSERLERTDVAKETRP
jgi:hypothetical protein